MPACIKCGAYTKFQNGTCHACYHSKNGAVSSDYEDDIIGLNDDEWEYRYSMIKGRIAETLIQELFLSLKYNVFRYGMEHTVPGIAELLRGVKGEVAKQIKRMPDFVIQHKDSKKTFFVEVKFRANESFSEENLPLDYPYENAFIILVSKKHIKCLSVQELKNGKAITPSCHNYLGNRKEFDLDKEVIKNFCEFAVQFFATV